MNSERINRMEDEMKNRIGNYFERIKENGTERRHICT